MQFGAGLSIPESRCTIVTAGQQVFAIGRELQTCHGKAMADQCIVWLERPQTRCTHAIRRQRVTTVRGEHCFGRAYHAWKQ